MSGSEGEISTKIGQEKEELKKYLENQGVFSWHTYLKYGRSRKPEPGADLSLQHYRSAAEKADSMMNFAYLACNLSVLAFALAVFFLPQLAWLPIAVFAVGAIWNYFDAIAGFVLALYQGKTHDLTAAGVNIFSSLQLTAATSLLVVALLGVASGSLLSLASLASGFSFVAAMGIAVFLEYRALRKSEERLEQIASLPADDPNLSPSLRLQLEAYQKTEREIEQSHRHNTKVLFACFIAIALIATIGVLPLAPPLNAILFITAAVVCCLTAIYRAGSELRLKTPEPMPLSQAPSSTAELQKEKAPAPKQELKKGDELNKGPGTSDTHTHIDSPDSSP